MAGRKSPTVVVNNTDLKKKKKNHSRNECMVCDCTGEVVERREDVGAVSQLQINTLLY